MTKSRNAWVGSSVVATAAVTLWVTIAQFSTAQDGSPTNNAASPLQIEMQSLDATLTRWIDDKDPIARGDSLDNIDALQQAAWDGLKHDSSDQSDALLSMIASLKAGMQALTIQDRLILLAEQEVRRAQNAASVDRLFQANERREEIILIMIQPAVQLLRAQIDYLPGILEAPEPRPTQVAVI